MNLPHIPIWLIALIVIAAIAAAVLKELTKKERTSEAPRARPVLTQRELDALRILKTAFEPTQTVLAQVAFSALLTAKSRATRNTFDRKVADFAVLSTDGAVIALIEIDDSSHDGRQAHDRARDAMLIGAGYRVLRYRKMPTVELLRIDAMRTTGT